MGILYLSPDKPCFVIGRDPGCDLVLDGSFISRRHLCFRSVRPDVALLEVTGTNGAVVGHTKVNKGYRGYLRPGDPVSIGSCAIVWCGHSVAGIAGSIRGLVKLPRPDIPPVEIEGPPPRRVPEKPSMMLAAGPALTMAIPVLLGAGRGVAILSSLFAALWAAINVAGRVRKQKTEEKRRKNTYMSYLTGCEAEIRTALSRIRRLWEQTVPEAADYLKDGGDPFILWNRHPGADGLLEIRVGKGTVPCPIKINIPKDRFAGVDDSLKELPELLRKKYQNIPSMPYLINPTARSILAFVMHDQKDRETVAAFIMQIAVAYSPEDITISIKTDNDTIRYFMWIAWLPHYRHYEKVSAGSEGERIMITDDKAAAYEAATAGCVVILLADKLSDLPEGIITVVNRGRENLVCDRIPDKLCYSYAAQMAASWEDSGEDTVIPGYVQFGELLDKKPQDVSTASISEMILAKYSECDITESVAAPLGLAAGGKKTVLDLHERAAGPHGLVAGTTGSGKSELLTTLILSFSGRYPPDKLAFFIIDYKGGGMSGLFGDLPHLVGSISNLSGGGSKRAMKALRSENLRRQRLFAASGVNNINDYTRLYDAGKADEPLPHVLIIVDEFAELRKEEPEFMDCLISVSQIGRSLGMHLILATQKPAGIVDERIRSNTGFRIALRLVDRADSMDMLRREDAALIRECGRAYLQVGNDEIFECFQSAYSMGSADEDISKIRIYEDFFQKEEVFPQDPGPLERTGRKRTWYELFLEAVNEAVRKGKYRVPDSLWLPPLPDKICDEGAFLVFDNPFMQRYERIVYDPSKTGHILICGMSGLGKSELLYTLIRQAEDAAIYVIDPAGGRLSAVSDMYCCGGYVTEDAPQDMARMTGFIKDTLLGRRKHALSGKSPPRTMILILDDLAQIESAAPAGTMEDISFILTMGAKAGIFVAASSVFMPPPKTAALFTTTLFLGSGDAYTVASALKVSIRDIPETEDIPGRGIGLHGGLALEFQASLMPQKSPGVPDGYSIIKYPHVPEKPTLRYLFERAGIMDGPPASLRKRPYIPAGFEYESGRIYTLPTDRVRCILVCGKAYSGKHTFLSSISVIAQRYGIECIAAGDHATLMSACRQSSGFCIVTVENITRLMSDFYDGSYTREYEEELASCFENTPVTKKAECGYVIIGIIDNDARTMFSGRRIMDSILRHPYGISFGGNLDENRVLDYSYMPFSKMQKPMKSHNATILKFDEKSFAGHVIFPVADQCG